MKQKIRSKIKKQLQEKITKVQKNPDFSVSNKNQLSAILQTTKTLFAYMPIQQEVNIIPLIKIALEKSILLGLPRVENLELVFHAINPEKNTKSYIHLQNNLLLGYFGILEPNKSLPVLFTSKLNKQKYSIMQTIVIRFPLTILVPGLAFTEDGIRLGRGAGYYDRFLHSLLSKHAENRKEIHIIGVCYRFQIVKNLPSEPHDIPMDRLLIIEP